MKRKLRKSKDINNYFLFSFSFSSSFSSSLPSPYISSPLIYPLSIFVCSSCPLLSSPLLVIIIHLLYPSCQADLGNLKSIGNTGMQRRESLHVNSQSDNPYYIKCSSVSLSSFSESVLVFCESRSPSFLTL